MTSSTLKSQPLHNFQLHDLKWSNPSDDKSKIYLRLPPKNKESVVAIADVADQSLIVEGNEELVSKTRKLRPRKPIPKPPSAPKIGASAHEKATRSRNVTEPKTTEKKENKKKFSISLSREEIGDDIFALTGSKASRRPKKRAKNVQKQVDYVFPGLWLDSISPDCYRVPETPLKG